MIFTQMSSIFFFLKSWPTFATVSQSRQNNFFSQSITGSPFYFLTTATKIIQCNKQKTVLVSFTHQHDFLNFSKFYKLVIKSLFIIIKTVSLCPHIVISIL